MAHLNLLKGTYTGKLGQTVGAKWKNKNTIRVYAKPAYTNTPPQQIIRAGFAEISSYVALFADQIKPLSALNTKGMTVRNAIVKLNRDMIGDGAIKESDLLVSRGGLPPPRSISVEASTGLKEIIVSWIPVIAATVSTRAKVVAIVVSPDHYFAAVASALNTEGGLTINTDIPPSAKLHVHYYLLDYRGSSKVASMSGYATTTSPATK